MSNLFEKFFQIPEPPIEKYNSIEMTDLEYIQKYDQNYQAQLVYKPPAVLPGEILDSRLKEKYELAKSICKEAKIIKLGNEDERIESKASKKTIKKNNSKCNKKSVEKVQEKLQ